MKKIIEKAIFISLILICISCKSIFAEDTINLFKNPGFELPMIGNEIPNWKKAGGGAFGSVTEEKNTGDYSGKLAGRAAGYESLRQKVELQYNRTYLISCYLKLAVGSPDARFAISDSKSYSFFTPETTVTANDWTKLSGEVKITEDRFSSPKLEFFAWERTSPATSAIYNDDYVLTPKYIGTSIAIKGDDVGVKPDPNGDLNSEIPYTIEVENQIGTTEDMASLPISYSVYEAQEGTEDFTPATGVSYDSTNNKLIITKEATTTKVKLCAESTDYKGTFSGEKIITLSKFKSDNEALQETYDWLTESTISLENLNCITRNLTLPLTSGFCSISWSSDNKDVLTDDGIVTSSDLFDVPINLTATITRNSAVKTKEFKIIVKQFKNHSPNGDFEGSEILNWTTENLSDKLDFLSETGYNNTIGAKFEGEGTICVPLERMENEKIYIVKGWFKPEKEVDLTISLLQGKTNNEIHTKKLLPNEWNEFSYEFIYNKTEEIPILTISPNVKTTMFFDDIFTTDFTDMLNNAINLVIKAETSRLQADIDSAKEFVNQLSYCSKKEPLQSRINSIIAKSNEVISDGGSGSSSSSSGSSSFIRSFPISDKLVEETPKKETIPSITFIDISNCWAKDTIEEMGALGFITGYADGSFKPDLNITRAECGVVLMRVLNLKEKKHEGVFKDVAESDWYSGTIQAIYDAGIMNGNDEKFRPNDKITREELAKITVKAYEVGTKHIISNLKDLHFDDVEDISDWSYDYIQKAYTIGLLSGNDNKINPAAYATRAETAEIINRLFDIVSKETK